METPKLTPADIDIIRCVQEDARSPVAKIAKRLRMPESTVRHRLNRLVRQGVIEFSILINPHRLGYQIWAVIEIQAAMPKIRSVAQQLAAIPEVYFLGITTGSYDLLAAAVFRSNQELLDFLTRRLGKVRGILRTSTSSVLELVKHSMTLDLPNGKRRAGRPPGPGGVRPRRTRPGFNAPRGDGQSPGG